MSHLVLYWPMAGLKLNVREEYPLTRALKFNLARPQSPQKYTLCNKLQQEYIN